MSKADGKYIAIRFTQPLTNEFTGAEAAAFSVTGQVYDMVPEGELIAGDFQVDAVEGYPVPKIWVDDFTGGSMTDVQLSSEGLMLEVG